MTIAENSKENDMTLPPKLDLRKAGILKSKPVDSAAQVYSSKIQPATSCRHGMASDGEKQAGKVDESAKTRHIKIPEIDALVETLAKKSEPAPAGEKAGASTGEKGPETRGFKKSEAMPISAPAESSGEPETPPAAAKPFPAVAPTTKSDEKKLTSKKETARIPLEIAMPTDKGRMGILSGVPTKSPDIRSTMAPIAIKLSKPQTLSSVPESSEEASVPTKKKRETSRISLEAVLGREAGFEEPKGVPKTIRLKRPSELSTAKVLQPPDMMEMRDEKVALADLSKTAILEEAVTEPAEASTSTRRKTIRIKRLEKRPTVESVTVAGVQKEAKPGKGTVAAATEAAVDEPGLFFPLAVIAAILIVCVVIYMLMAQAFGPNTSLTQLSYGAPDLDLAWPGKIYQ